VPDEREEIDFADANSANPEKKILSPDFKILETFINIANLRTFRRAVKTLNTTQPLVSMRIKQLDEHLRIRPRPLEHHDQASQPQRPGEQAGAPPTTYDTTWRKVVAIATKVAREWPR
jgi:Bacterial regulatory helix-turn-helix protein, lysR family